MEIKDTGFGEEITERILGRRKVKLAEMFMLRQMY